MRDFFAATFPDRAEWLAFLGVIVWDALALACAWVFGG